MDLIVWLLFLVAALAFYQFGRSSTGRKQKSSAAQEVRTDFASDPAVPQPRSRWRNSFDSDGDSGDGGGGDGGGGGD